MGGRSVDQRHPSTPLELLSGKAIAYPSDSLGSILVGASLSCNVGVRTCLQLHCKDLCVRSYSAICSKCAYDLLQLRSD